MTIINKRFWSKIEKTEGCWLWIGLMDGNRPKFYFEKHISAVRFMWLLTKGHGPKGFVHRTCKNKRCVNPSHLSLENTPYRAAIPASEIYEKRVIKKHGCWDWIGSLDSGYGRIGKTFAHRVSWAVHNGPIPFGMFVLHKCDNRKCTNPEHLFLGSQSDNSLDMLKKKRSPVLGNKLTIPKVRRIRFLREMGWTYRSLSEEFKVSTSTINGIVNRKKWAWLD